MLQSKKDSSRHQEGQSSKSHQVTPREVSVIQSGFDSLQSFSHIKVNQSTNYRSWLPRIIFNQFRLLKEELQEEAEKIKLEYNSTSQTVFNQYRSTLTC